ncbi:MAG: transcription antitermination factor NusB [Candidatus Ozemobacteraceae bacterium]
MSSRRRKAREAAIKALYQVDLVGEEPLVALDGLINEEVLKPILEPLGRDLAHSGGLPGDSTAEEIETFSAEFVWQFINERPMDPTESGNETALRDFVARFMRAGLTSEDVLTPFIKRLKEKLAAVTEIRGFARLLIDRVLEHRPQIDGLLETFADNWKLDRMASLDRSILRSGVCELLFFPDIPINVTLNEAIELAKKYSTERSAEFVNGLLDKIQREKAPVKEESASGQTAGRKNKTTKAPKEQIPLSEESPRTSAPLPAEDSPESIPLPIETAPKNTPLPVEVPPETTPLPTVTPPEIIPLPAEAPPEISPLPAENPPEVTPLPEEIPHEDLG